MDQKVGWPQYYFIKDDREWGPFAAFKMLEWATNGLIDSHHKVLATLIIPVLHPLGYITQ